MSDSGTNPQEVFEQAGISKEEQSEVLEHIERIATENRIQTTPELFSLKNVRSGFLFPVLVDGIAIVVIAVTVLLLVFLYQRSEQKMVGSSGEYATIEGQLIRALQQESQQRLLDKDQQIATVRAQLAAVEKQRQELASSMDTKLRQREEEYRQKIQAELQAERERLIKQGVASDAMARMLATYEAERKAYYDRQLAEYRQQLEGERAAVEQQLTQLQNEYESRVQSLRQEREQLVSEYRQREDALQAQLEQRTRVLDVARVEAIQNLAAAQSRMQQLARSQAQTSIVQDQILGQFEQIRRALQSNDAQGALKGIGDLKSYLSDEKVVSIAEISRQREMDLFLLDSLQRLVQGQQQESKSISSLSDDLVLLTRLRDTAAEAVKARSAGDTARADKLYGDLLAFMPVIADAHTTLLTEARDKALETAADTLKKDQQERRDQFAALSEKAATAIRNGNYDEAYASYRQALGLDPAVGQAGQQTASELARLGFVLSAFVGQSDANPKALAAIRQAGIDRAAQDTAFVAQTQRVANAQQRALLDRQQQLTDEIARLNAQKNTLQQTTTDQLAALRQQNAERVSSLNTTIRTREQEVTDLQSEVSRLTEFEKRVTTLQSDYRTYTQKEDTALRAGGPNAILDGKLALETFLASPEMTRLFPDFGRRLRAYDAAFQEAGRQSGLQDASDLVGTLSGFQNVQQQRAYLDAQITRTTDDPTFKDFLTALRQYLR